MGALRYVSIDFQIANKYPCTLGNGQTFILDTLLMAALYSPVLFYDSILCFILQVNTRAAWMTVLAKCCFSLT